MYTSQPACEHSPADPVPMPEDRINTRGVGAPFQNKRNAVISERGSRARLVSQAQQHVHPPPSCDR